MSDLFEPVTNQEIDPNKNYLEELVGDGRKFKSVEDLARGKAESDSYITQLRKDLEEAQQELRTRARLEELITKVTPPQAPEPGNHQLTPNEFEKPANTMDELTPEKLDALLEAKLRTKELEMTKARNLTAVKQGLVEKYGPNYVEVLTKVAAALGETPEYLNEQAARNPNAFWAIVGGQAPASQRKESLFSPPQAHLNSSGFEPGPTVRNKSWYDALKKNDPAKYRHPETEKQMMQDALRLKEAFFQ